MYLGDTAPKGWLVCNGAGYATTAYPALYAVLSTRYGSTSGFQVPDMRNYIPVGPGGDFSTTLGTTGGVDTVSLTSAESGYPSHRHSTTDVYATTGSAVEAGSALYSDYNANDVARFTSDNTAVNATSGGAHENRMPYLVLNYIIKAF
jgi:microcystin-dependent protein